MAVVHAINGTFAYDLSQSFKSVVPGFALDSTLAPCGLKLPAGFNNTIRHYWLANTDNTQLDFAHHQSGNSSALEAYFYARVALGDLERPEWHELVPVTKVRGVGDNLVWNSTATTPTSWIGKRGLVQKTVFTFSGNSTDPNNLLVRYSCTLHVFTGRPYINTVPTSEGVSLEPVTGFDLKRLNLDAPLPYQHANDNGIWTQSISPAVATTTKFVTSTSLCTSKSINGLQVVGIVMASLVLVFLMLCTGAYIRKARIDRQQHKHSAQCYYLQSNPDITRGTTSSGLDASSRNTTTTSTASVSETAPETPFAPDSQSEPLLPVYAEQSNASSLGRRPTNPPAYKP